MRDKVGVVINATTESARARRGSQTFAVRDLTFTNEARGEPLLAPDDKVSHSNFGPRPLLAPSRPIATPRNLGR